MAVTVTESAGNTISVSVSDGTTATFSTTTNSISVSPSSPATINVAAGASFTFTGSTSSTLPTGGLENQFLQKNSAADYHAKWSAYTLPAADGTDGQVLTTDGAGTVSFAFPKTIAEVVKNVTAGTLTKGTPVHVTGNSGNEAEVVAADALIANAAYPAHFVLNEDIVSGGTGLGIALGFINNVDAAPGHGISPGDTIYLASSGGFTSTRPSGDTNAVQNLGVALKVNTAPTPNKISGVIMGAGRSNDVPNIATGKIWVGDASGVATATDTAYIDITNGRVGIGTTSPSGTLEVIGTLKSEFGLQNVSGTDDMSIYNLTNNAGYIRFINTTSGAQNEAMRILNNGNVGIGTTAPTEKLHVVGRARILDSGNNTLIGSSWGSISTASNNAGIGNQALSSISTGQFNTSIGTQAGKSISSGQYNVAVGYLAGKSITTQEYTVAVGYGAGQFVAPSSSTSLNTLVGTLAGNGVEGASTYNANTAVGYRALLGVTTGSSNVSIGAESMDKATTAANNVAVGRTALRYLTTGNSNIAIGYQAALGQSTLSTFSNTVAIGFSALAALTTGDGNVAIGYQAALGTTTGTGGVSIGYQAGRYSTGGLNIAIGYNALLGVSGSTSVSGVIAIGRDAFSALTTGSDGVAIGYFAGYGVSTGANNTAIGHEAMKAANSSLSVAIGRSALWGVSGNTPTSNVAIGVNAMRLAETTSSYSIAIGYAAMENVTGGNNVGVGYVAMRNLTTGSGNVAIGYSAGSQLTTESNKLYIENSDSTTPLIYGEFDNDIVRVNGELQVGDPSGTGFKFPTIDGTASYVLQTNGSGTVSWAAMSGGASVLNDLTDVSAGSPTSGDVIVYNGSNWATSASLQNLIEIVKEPTSDTATLEKDTSNKITIDKSVGAENITHTVAGTAALAITSTALRSYNYIAQDQSEVQFREASVNGTNHISLKAPANVATNVAFVLPNADGSADQVLKTNGSAALGWTTLPASGVDFDPVGTDNSTDVSINANASDVLRMNAGQVLGAEDAAADKLVFWDDSESKLTYATLGTNLTMTGSTLAAADAPVTALNNQAADRLTTIGATTTELDGEANLTFDGTTLTVAGEMKAQQVYVNVRFTGTPSNGAFLDGARIGRGFFNTGSITAGSVYYLGSTSWALADADAASTGSGLLAVATDAGSAAEVLLEGAIKLSTNSGYSGAAKGDVLYLSLTAGEVTNDISGHTTGDIVRVLGYVLDASNNYIYFNPDNTWLEI